MDRIYALTILLFLTCLTNTAFANYPATMKYEGATSSSVAYFDSADGACSVLTPPAGYTRISATYYGDKYWDCKSKNSENTVFTYGSVRTVQTCNGTFYFDYRPSEGLADCTGTAPTECTAGKDAQTGTEVQLTSKVTSYCKNGCSYSAKVTASVVNTTGTGQSRYYTTVGNNTGTACSTTPTPAEPQPQPEYDCVKAGKSYGQVNGVTVCVPKGTTGTPDVTNINDGTKTQGADGGNKTTTSKTTTSNPDGSITTSTTTTVKDASGNVVSTGTDKKDQDKQGFCEENPTSTICKESQFGGSCGAVTATFACEGDAVQCAIALKQHNDRCDDLRADAVSDLGKAMIAHTDSLPSADPFTNPTELEIGSINSNGFLSNQCPIDIQTSIAGQGITVPISKLCDGLQIAGAIVLAFAYVVAARIIFS